MDIVNSIAGGDEMKSVSIKGDTAALLKKQEASVSEWNKVLDAKYPRK